VEPNQKRNPGDLLFVIQSPGDTPLAFAGRETATELVTIIDSTVTVEADSGLNKTFEATTQQLTHDSDDGAIIFFADPTGMMRIAREIDPSFLRNRHVIIYLGDESLCHGDATLQALEWVDEIWVPSHFALRTLGTLGHPAYVVPVPIRAPKGRPYPRSHFNLLGRRKIYLAVLDASSSLDRQNPAAAIQAFRAAFPDRNDVELVILLQDSINARGRLRYLSELNESDHRIWYWDTPLSPEETTGLIQTADALVSLHRSNAFGIHIAQAMCAGTAVIVSQWGGSADFTTAENSFLVQVGACPLGESLESTPASWREPDHAEAVRAFRMVAEEREHTQQIVAHAAETDFAAQFRRSAIDRLRPHIDSTGNALQRTEN
jgi:glycosyltransferase involved in cell wall biosynthesis